MKQSLTIMERMILIGMLDGVASSRAKRKIIEDKIRDLSLSEKEIKDTNYQEEVNGKSLSFNYITTNDPMKEIEFDETVLIPIIQNSLKELDKHEKIDKTNSRLYDLFVNG